MTLILCHTPALIGRTRCADERPEMSGRVRGLSGQFIGASAAALAQFLGPGSRGGCNHGAGPRRSAVCSALRVTGTAKAAPVFLNPLPGTERARPPARATGRQRCQEESIRPPKSHPRIPCALTPQRKQASACEAVWVLFLLMIDNLLPSHPLLSSKRPQHSRHMLSGHTRP